MIAWRWAALLVATACGAPPTPEQLADRAAADGRWEEALAALSQAEPTAGVLARRAEAAGQTAAAVVDAWTESARIVRVPLDYDAAGEGGR